MADRTIPGRDGSSTIISDSYGFGSMVVGPPIRPEDPSKYQVKWLTEDELLAQQGLSRREQLDVAISFLGFPQPRVPIKAGWFSWQNKTVRTWRQSEVDTWRERHEFVFPTSKK